MFELLTEMLRNKKSSKIVNREYFKDIKIENRNFKTALIKYNICSLKDGWGVKLSYF